MQNRYVGDTGDFSKYLLLKILCKTDLKLGVNWCLAKNDSIGNDGKFINYLDHEENEFSLADQDLFEGLRSIVKTMSRNVNSVINGKILPESVTFYSELIPIGVNRFAWHEKGMEKLTGCDIIFYDPDNGLEIKSKGRLHKDSIKYVFYEEIRNTFNSGKSIIVYQHANRQKNQILKRMDELCNCLPISNSDISIVYSGKGNGRFFLIIKQQKHKIIINKNLHDLENHKISKILRLRDLN